MICKGKRITKRILSVISNKVFGKNFEFSEKYLTSNIKPEIIIRALRKRYGFTKITKATLKHVLYEGARLNHILRINDFWYEKMVEILDIQLDPESDDDSRNKNPANFHLPVNILI